MSPLRPPGPEAVARVRALADRTLDPDEFRRLLAVPLGHAEEEDAPLT